jgi:oligopeptide/dipeptide ABC transporter ATP-binding protein
LNDGTVVTIRNLTVHVATIDGTLKVLDDVSLDIGEGEVIGLVGETGCGKTMTAKTLLGILPTPPAKIVNGRIHFLNSSLLELSRSQRQKIRQKVGYIPQDPMSSLNPVFTIGAMLMDNLIWRMSNMSLLRYLFLRRRKKIKRASEQCALDLLNRVHVPDPRAMLGKYPIELSGGLRQRALIAMSLAGDPVLLIADEPTTALDVTIQKVILNLLLDNIKEKGLSGLYITHDLGVARILCNRTYVMYAGTVVEAAKTTTLLNNPLHPYTKGLVNSIPKLTGEKFEGIGGTVPDFLNPHEGCRYYPRCDERQQYCSRDKTVIREVQKEHFVACRRFE